MKYLNNIYTLSEAAELWKMNASSLRMAILRNQFDNTQIRKSGGTWLVLKSAMEEVYGQIKTCEDLFTIGYEGKTITEFTNILNEREINILVDVRETPFSYKKGFSKSPLKDCLQEENIEYYNFKEIGSPKEIRNKLRETKNYLDFFRAYENYIGQDDILNNILQLVYHNPDKNICLMCFENDANTCHRLVLSDKLLKEEKRFTRIINL